MIHVRNATFAQIAERWVEQHAAQWWSPITLHPDGSRSQTERVIVGTPSMSSITQALSEGLDLHKSVTVTDLSHEQQGWILRLKHYGSTEATTERFDRVVLAMPIPQASRIIAPQDPSALSECPTISYEPTWACMMTLQVGEDLCTLPDIVDTDDGDRVVFAHRKPGHPLPAGTTALVFHANHAWSASHRDASPGEVCSILGQRALDIMKNQLGVSISRPQILDQQAHRWGLARATNPACESHWYCPDRSLGCCSDGFGGSDAESACLSGIAMARTIVAAQAHRD